MYVQAGRKEKKREIKEKGERRSRFKKKKEKGKKR